MSETDALSKEVTAFREMYGGKTEEEAPNEEEPGEAVSPVCCPFCGQVSPFFEGRDPREVCRCAGATKWRDEEEVQEAYLKGLETLCGADCREQSPEFEPVSEETMAALSDMASCAAHGVTGSITVTLPDGSKVRLANGKVQRSLNVRAEA